MALPGWLTLNVFVMLIDGMLLSFVLRKHVRTLQDRTYARLLSVVLLLLIMDSISRITPDLLPQFPSSLAHFGTLFIFAGDPLGYLFALSYIDSWVNPSRTVSHARTAIFSVCTAYVVLNAAAVLVSALLDLGWFYTYTPANAYVRGPLYVPRGICNMLFCLVVGLYAVIRRRDIRERYRHFILAFPLIVLVSGLLQVTLGGVAYEYAGTVFACLLLFMYVQDHNTELDYLTGLLNRRGIDRELANHTTRGNRQRAFAACMVDLDHFKSINDDYGHDAGDQALRLMSRLLVKAFGSSYHIGRYGGDEFLVLSECVAPTLTSTARLHQKTEDCIGTLRTLCTTANKDGKRPYQLDFSAGFAVYNPTADSASLEAFIIQLDTLMYNQKAAHHAATAAERTAY